MTTKISAAASGTFELLGAHPIHRLGFGAMRVTGPGIWGPPKDLEGARATLRRLPDLGVDFIDTAESYGPHVSEELIRETLHPYKGLLIATKGGMTRSGPDRWRPDGHPAFLRAGVTGSLKRLGVDRIDLWQLHRIDGSVPRDEQFAAIAAMRTEGLIRDVGLSEVSVEEIQAAQKHFPVATVQNQYNLVDRKSEAVLAYCEAHGIGFIPWFPLAAGALARTDGPLAAISKKLGATPAQIALAWTLKRSKVMLPIPGTSKVEHLEQNVAAAAIALSDEDFAALDHQGRGAKG